MDNSSTPRHLWLVLSLCAGFIASMAMTSGCKTGMMSMDNGPFKMLARGGKKQSVAPPSRHFDEGMANSSSDPETKVVIDEPDINKVAALDSSKPSQSRSPTIPATERDALAANTNPAGAKSPGAGGSGFGFPDNASSITGNNAAGTLESPIRKPYQMAADNGDRLKNAASELSRDLDRMSDDTRSRFAAVTDAGLRPATPAATEQGGLSDSLRGSTAGIAPGNQAGTGSPANQFFLPATNPGTSPQADNGERPRFGFSVPPTNPGNGMAGSGLPAQPSNNQFVAVPGSSQPVDIQATLSPLQPKTPDFKSAPSTTGNTGRFPSTGYGSYTTTPGTRSGDSSQNQADPASGTQPPNSRWLTMPQSTSPPFGADSAQKQAGLAAGLPDALLQRSGSYSPGSTRIASPSQDSNWR